MATISFSTAYASKVTDNLTTTSPSYSSFSVYTGDSSFVVNTAAINTAAAQTNLLMGSLFSYLIFGSYSSLLANATTTPSAILFKDGTNQTLISYTLADLTRSVDADGYVVISNFAPKTPSLAGTISSIEIVADTSVNNKQITFSVGAPGGGADIQFDDRDLVTSQPWRLDGNIKFRVPISYTYTV
jgi:hypothetical protein